MISTDIIKLLFQKPSMTFQEIMTSLSCGRTNCNNALDQLKAEGLIETEPKNWRKGQKLFFSLTGKGRDYALEKIAADLHFNYELLKNALEKTLTPTSLNFIRRDAAFHPTRSEIESGHIEANRTKEMLEHKAQVLAPLNNLFLELAKDLAKAEGFIGVRDDAKNVECHLRDGKLIWTIHPDKSYWNHTSKT